MPTARLSTGIEMYYEIHGEGEPLLLIMGTGAAHDFWQLQVPAYSQEYKTIVYDARGTGQTTATRPPYTVRSLADDAVALLDALGIKQAHVSGMSLGSATAQELAVNYPDRVLTLQLHVTWGRSDEWFRRCIETIEYPVRHGDLVTFARYAFMWVSSPTLLNNEPERVAELERTYLEGRPSIDGLMGHFAADKTHDCLDRLHEIRVPTLVTSGELDWQVPTRYGLEVQRRIPGAEMHVFRGPYSSHNNLAEMPDEFNRVTLEFLRRHARSRD